MSDPNEPQIIRTPAGDDLVVLTRAEYDRLLNAAGEALEDAADIALFDERIAEAMSGAEQRLPEQVSAAMLRGDSLLRALRKWRGLTQVQLADKARITQGMASDLEVGRRRATEDVAKRIAKALKVDIQWVRGRPDDQAGR